MFEHIEPFYGWLHLYNHEGDEYSPFHEVVHNLFYYDRQIYTFNAHPCWDTIESESLLLKILYADYGQGFAILEFLGEWNDLFDNDFKLLSERCLRFLLEAGINKFIFIVENVFNAYLQQEDYYHDFTDELADGWMCLLRPRPNVVEEFERYNIGPYFFWSEALDELRWRKLKPWELFEVVERTMHRYLLV